MKKRNKKTLIIVSVILVALLIMGYFAFILYSTKSMVTQTAIGPVKSTITTSLNLFTMHTQQTFLTPTKATVGTPIQVADALECVRTYGNPLRIIHYIIRSDTPIINSQLNVGTVLNRKIAEIDVTQLVQSRPTMSDIIVTTFTPTQPGFYTVVSMCLMPDYTPFLDLGTQAEIVAQEITPVNYSSGITSEQPEYVPNATANITIYNNTGTNYIYYRLQNNVCTTINLPQSMVTANDYETQAECESAKTTISNLTYPIIAWSILSLIIVILFILIIVSARKRRKR